MQRIDVHTTDSGNIELMVITTLGTCLDMQYVQMSPANAYEFAMRLGACAENLMEPSLDVEPWSHDVDV